MDLHVREQNGQHVRRWASEQEISAWKQRVQHAQERVTQMNEAAALALQRRNAAMWKIEPATREMERLANEEIRIRHEIDGAI